MEFSSISENSTSECRAIVLRRSLTIYISEGFRSQKNLFSIWRRHNSSARNSRLFRFSASEKLFTVQPSENTDLTQCSFWPWCFLQTYIVHLNVEMNELSERWAGSRQLSILTPFVCSSRNHLLFCCATASQLLPHIIIIMREGTQTVNAMLSFCDQDRMIMIIIFVHHEP